MNETFEGEQEVVACELDADASCVEDQVQSFDDVPDDEEEVDSTPISQYLDRKSLKTFSAGAMKLIKSEDPFEWWSTKVKERQSFKNLARLACMLLSHPLSSAWSETIFSYAGTQCSGKRSRLKVERLNCKQLIKSNCSLLSELDWQLLPERIQEIEKQKDDKFGILEAEELNNVLLQERSCPHCTNSVLEGLKNTSRTQGVVKCDHEECQLHQNLITADAYYYGCKTCNEWDLCMQCFQKD
jgi:hypothetical protein